MIFVIKMITMIFYSRLLFHINHPNHKNHSSHNAAEYRNVSAPLNDRMEFPINQKHHSSDYLIYG